MELTRFEWMNIQMAKSFGQDSGQDSGHVQRREPELFGFKEIELSWSLQFTACS